MSRSAVALALLVVGGAGCGGDGETPAVAKAAPCSPGVQELTLSNGQAAQLRVTPGNRARALVVVLHGAGGSPADGLAAFRGAWSTPGLVLAAPASKGSTWSALQFDQDEDLESVNLVLAEAYERCTIDRSRIAVAGFSDGASYALTLAVSNGDLFPMAIAFSPGGIVGGQQVGVPRVFVSHGTLDPVLPIDRSGDAAVKTLRDAGYPVTYRRFRGGHEVPEAISAAAVRWFLAGAR